MTTQPEPVAAGPVPVLAVVGRPNVGKSTLVNRMIGRREAVVQDVPGVTRDRVSYDATWNGRAFTVVDTGGWDPDAHGLMERIAAQAEVATTIADAVLFVVDATVGITDTDEAVVRILRKSGKPVVLAANKVDDERAEAEAHALWNLGLGEPIPVSALHGRGSGDMLDAVLKALPEPPEATYGEVGGPRRVAIVGRPNVGKSSLLNKLAKQERAVVDDVAGTTVDPVDELVEMGGRTWRLIDTAGVRRRVKEASGHEYYASLRTNTAIERAEVCVVVVDGSQPISEQDTRIITAVAEAGRALVIAFNKWDLVDEERRYYLDREVDRDLVRVPWAPRVNIAARTGWHVDKLVPSLDAALAGWSTRDRHRRAELVPRPPGRRAPAPGPRRQAAAHPVRDAAVHRAADVRAVHDRQARGVVPPLRRAPAPRGLRLRRQPGARPAAPTEAPRAPLATGWSSCSLRVGRALDPVATARGLATERQHCGSAPGQRRGERPRNRLSAESPPGRWFRGSLRSHLNQRCGRTASAPRARRARPVLHPTRRHQRQRAGALVARSELLEPGQCGRQVVRVTAEAGPGASDDGGCPGVLTGGGLGREEAGGSVRLAGGDRELGGDGPGVGVEVPVADLRPGVLLSGWHGEPGPREGLPPEVQREPQSRRR